ncbi:MAG: hypothetical protein ABJF04_00810 [Reichenbachiella sp.]|uniref:hypothetical protein n=1 Tax=Reichenbachiella sp. TaxID=2184521 RepID=UPI00326755D9
MNWLKYLKFFLLIAIYTVTLSMSAGQSVRDQFNSAKSSHSSGYDEFVEQKDKEFADFLRKNWRAFQLHDGIIIEPRPKPVEFPRVRKIIPESKKLEQSHLPQKLDLLEELVMPVNHKRAVHTDESKTVAFPFFGDTVLLKYDTNLDLGKLNFISPATIGDFWEKISQSNYRLALERFLYYKMKYRLNDYGYYLLIKEFTSYVFSTENKRRLFTWFILSKSKYKSKIGYNENQVYLLLPSNRKVFGKSYFTHNEIPFYVMDYSGGELYAYEEDYPGAYKTMDFTINEALNLKQSSKYNLFDFSYMDKSYNFKFEYNKNAIDLYNVIPSIALDGYFNSHISEVTKQSLIHNLHPIMEPMDELEAVGFLLALVQKSFSYKIDEAQFGEEKVFFPEEILHYPFSDCEDRSVFFAYLVNTLLGNEVVGLDYPSHVATAVRFETEVAGDYFMLNDKKYVVCDPTYVNAPVGMSMRDLSNYSAEIIQMERSELSFPALENLKEMLGIKGELTSPEVIKIEEGTIMAGNFSQSILIQDEAISTSGYSLLLASFDIDNKAKWSKTISVDPEKKLKKIAIDKEGNIVLLTVTKKGSYQLSKLDQKGYEMWSTIVGQSDSVIENATTQITLFDEQGNKLAGKSYAETQYFDPNPLSIRKNNILVILPLEDD